MASLQRRRVRGHTYWYIVESRRVNGKPRPIPIAYLGKADDLLARLQANEGIRIRSRAHGAVAALHALAQELDVAGTIDRHLQKFGRRLRPSQKGQGRRHPQRNDGLTVGQSLCLVAVGRACHATSKRAFASWARTTTLGELASIDDVERLTSQHFWDQMDQLHVDAIAPIEQEIVGRAIEQFGLTLDTLLFDATNFFTFIASTNTRPKLPVRGKQKQKRNDLRQVGVALLCSRQHGIPLWHCTYGGNVPDTTCFSEALPLLEKRMIDMGCDIDTLTVVYDKGNVSRENQRLVDESKFHYVSALTVASQRDLVDEANPQLAPVEIQPGETVPAYRTKREIWGSDRTVVVLCSERLRQGQMAGVMQHVAKAQKWLSEQVEILRRGKQRRDRARIQRDIENHIKGRQHLAEVIRWKLTGDDPHLALAHEFDQAAFDILAQRTFGRVVLMTDRHDWSTADIIRTYHGQSVVEAVFAHLKDPVHLALRPQRHWTDQKLHVHVFTCVLGYLLARLLHMRALNAGLPFASLEGLLEALAHVRLATVVRSTTGKGRLRVMTQLEELHPPLTSEHLVALGVNS